MSTFHLGTVAVSNVDDAMTLDEFPSPPMPTIADTNHYTLMVPLSAFN